MNITDDQENLEKAVKKQNDDLLTFFTNFTRSSTMQPSYMEFSEDDDMLKKTGDKNIRENLSDKGYKESKDKLTYELDWNFIQSIAERMSKNKGKYEPYNWKKPIDIESLKQSLFRHVVEVMKGDYEDDGRDLGHLEAIALNAMFIFYNLKNN